MSVFRAHLHTALLCATLVGATHPTALAAQSVVLRDSAQHELRLDRPAQRIVTLMPSLTETVCALGECARLVATDRYSDWPAAVRSLPKAGGLDDAQIELIVSLAPDVVILAHATRVTERLRDLGVRTFDVQTTTYADIARNVTALGLLLGVPQRAVDLNREIERSVAETAADARDRLHGRSPRIYYEIDTGPYAAGPQSFIGELLSRLGARNILTADLGPFPKLNPEYVVRENPDVIFVSATELSSLSRRPGWDEIRAIKENRLCPIDAPARDTLARPGPRVADGMRTMAQCLVRVAP
jgi:iron complex transport system substrate-binding protein